MSYYSVADINFEIANQKLNSERMQKFQIKKPEKIDIQYMISCIDDTFSYENLTLCYDGKLFREFEDSNYVYRVFCIYIGDYENQLIIVRPKKQCMQWKILLGKELKEQYSKYFDFANHLAFENILCEFKGFILHASVVAYEGKGILFTAPSGTGKSTQGELWKKYKNADVLNGDRAFIRKKEDGFWVYGSPLAGSSGIYKNEKVKINAIIVLRQAQTNTIRKLSAKDAFSNLYKETLINMWDNNFMTIVVEVISALVMQIPVYELSCRPDEESVDLVYETVIGSVVNT